VDTGREVELGILGSCRQYRVRLVVVGLLWGVRRRERTKGKGGQMEEMVGHIEKEDRGAPFFDFVSSVLGPMVWSIDLEVDRS